MEKADGDLEQRSTTRFEICFNQITLAAVLRKTTVARLEKQGA